MTIESNNKYEGNNFDDLDLRFIDIYKSSFYECSFKNTSMDESIINNCEFVKCDFKSARLNASDISNSAFLNCEFGFANLFVTKFIDCKMVGSIFVESNLSGVTITRGDWSYTNLRFQDFKGLDLSQINFTRADLGECNLENTKFTGTKLKGTNLSKTKLKKADLRGAIIEGINLSELDLHDVKIDIAQAIILATSFGAKVE